MFYIFYPTYQAELNLDKWGLTDDNLEFLAEEMPLCRNLLRISMNNNRIGSRGCVALCKAIFAKAPNLQQLMLGKNTIQKTGMSAICELLVNVKSINSLILDRNPIGDGGLLPLFEILPMCPHLQYLDIRYTNATDMAAKGLYDVFNRIIGIEVLLMDGNIQLSYEAVCALQEASTRCPSLKTFSLPQESAMPPTAQQPYYNPQQNNGMANEMDPNQQQNPESYYTNGYTVYETETLNTQELYERFRIGEESSVDPGSMAQTGKPSLHQENYDDEQIELEEEVMTGGNGGQYGLGDAQAIDVGHFEEEAGDVGEDDTNMNTKMFVNEFGKTKLLMDARDVGNEDEEYIFPGEAVEMEGVIPPEDLKSTGESWNNNDE